MDPQTVSRDVAITDIRIRAITQERYASNAPRLTFPDSSNPQGEGLRIPVVLKGSFLGNSGVFLQYTHARLISLQRKNFHLLPLSPSSEISTDSLASLLGIYPGVISLALEMHEGSGVVRYAFRPSHAISWAWKTVVVKGEEDVKEARAKMFLHECAREVLAAVMRLLSVRPLERIRTDVLSPNHHNRVVYPKPHRPCSTP